MSKIQKPVPIATDEVVQELTAIRGEIDALKAAVKALQSEARPKWGADDSAFMIFNLGFTAGAHMARTGEAAPACDQIFARCRDLYMKAFPGSGPLSPGDNPS